MYILEFSIKKNSISLQLKIFQIKYKTKNHFFFLESLAQILKSHKIYILLKKKKNTRATPGHNPIWSKIDFVHVLIPFKSIIYVKYY